MKAAELSHWEKLYLELSLQLNKYIPGFIDAYYGPADLKHKIEGQEKPSLSELSSMCKELLDLIKVIEFEESRRTYLLKQIQALNTSIKALSGEKFGFLEEVNFCFDIFPEKHDEDKFDEAISKFDEILPGKGSIVDRMALQQNSQVVAKKYLLTLLEASMKEVKERTLKLFELPPSEALEIKLASQQPWSAYNWYLGNYRSLIEFNTDFRSLITTLATTMAHEGYPGHHTEHCLKESLLYRQQGYIEHAVLLVRTPESVIAEGIATVANEVIFGKKELFEWVANYLGPIAQIDIDPELETEIISTRKELSYVGGNVAYLLYVENMPEDQVVDYMAKYGLMKKEDAKKRMDFIKDPLWRSYIYNYTEGYRLVKHYLGQPFDLNKFQKLLTEQIVPSQLY
ncbi:MAG: hypothetical protein ACFFC7_07070 [Candidatus Hermodarchaeota archaeon]